MRREVDLLVGERAEHARGDARVRAHAGSDRARPSRDRRSRRSRAAPIVSCARASARASPARRPAGPRSDSSADAVRDVLEDRVDVRRARRRRRRRSPPPSRAGRGRRAASKTTSSSECVTAETIGCSSSSRPRSRFPAPSENVERAWMRTPWSRASSTARSISTFAPGRRHLEHLLVRDAVELARVGDDPRVGGEDAGDVGVDLAGGAEGSGQRDRGRIGAAASERRHVHRVAREALIAGDEDDLALRRARSTTRRRRDLADLRLRVDGVGDDARPASP